MNNRLVKFLEDKNILAKEQYGFRKNRSATDAIHSFTDFIVDKMDKRQKCLTIFMDLQKAFDTVSTKRLTRKLEKIGIRGSQLLLFEDYLQNRSQSVRIGDVISDENPINFGVPQGSILGPTLFLCYINDLFHLNIASCKIISYADDTTLTFYGDTWEDTFDAAQEGFNLVNRWLAQNTLTLNAAKTKYVTFLIKNVAPEANNLKIYAHTCSQSLNTPCNCPVIQKTDNIKYLGITIDTKLSFKEHIKQIILKTRKLIYVFKNLRDVANWKLLKTVYESLGESIISYGIGIWGGTYKTLMLELERTQRMILKIALAKPRLFPTESLYQEAKVLSVRKLYILTTILKAHASINPSSLKDRAGTRRHFDICEVKPVKTSFAQKFFAFRGAKLYNMANKLLNISNLSKVECKRKITNWLLNLNYEQTENLLTIIT